MKLPTGGMFCDTIELRTGVQRCVQCRRKYRADSPVHARCSAGTILLGTFIARMLSQIGLTQQRWEFWTGKPCNCADRRDKLNRAHRAFKRWLSAIRKRLRGVSTVGTRPRS